MQSFASEIKFNRSLRYNCPQGILPNLTKMRGYSNHQMVWLIANTLNDLIVICSQPTSKTVSLQCPGVLIDQFHNHGIIYGLHFPKTWFGKAWDIFGRTLGHLKGCLWTRFISCWHLIERFKWPRVISLYINQ